MRWTAVSLAIFLMTGSASEAIGQSKVALVIGNDDYKGNQLLGNPRRDAALVGGALQQIGFTLVGGRPFVDLKLATMVKAINDFAVLAKNADIALVYFSGHGIQFNNRNYLVPIDFAPDGFFSSVSAIQTVNVDWLLNVLNESGARAKIVLLDACRTPFLKGGGGGLAPTLEAGSGTVIGYATRPNFPASPGPMGGSSPYAKALAHSLLLKGIDLFTLLNDVGLAVQVATGNAQQPRVENTPVSGKIYLNPIVSAPTVVGHTSETPDKPIKKVTFRVALDLVQQAHQQLSGNDYSGARATLTQAIESDRGFAPAYSSRGFAWYQEGKSREPQEAIEAFKKAFLDLDTAIELDPNYAAARRHRGNTIIATYRARKATGKPTNDILDRAIDDFKVAVNLDPQSKTNANALGEAYLLKGAYGLATENFNKAIALDRKYSSPYSGLCSAYYMQGKKTEARKNADLAASLDRKFASRSCLSNAI